MRFIWIGLLAISSMAQDSTSVRIVTERVVLFVPDAIRKTDNGYGTGVTWNGGVLTAAHTLEDDAEIYVMDGSEKVRASAVWKDKDWDIAFLKPDRPIKGIKPKNGLPCWIEKEPYQVLNVHLIGSRYFRTDRPYNSIHGASGGGIFERGKLLGILVTQRMDTERGVYCEMVPIYVIEALHKEKTK